jgi:hypothetical protein
VDAYRPDKVVAEPDPGGSGDPPVAGFSPPELQAGARAVFGFPLRVGAVRLGALNLYRDWPGPLSGDHHADALVVADVAASPPSKAPPAPKSPWPREISRKPTRPDWSPGWNTGSPISKRTKPRPSPRSATPAARWSTPPPASESRSPKPPNSPPPASAPARSTSNWKPQPPHSNRATLKHRATVRCPRATSRPSRQNQAVLRPRAGQPIPWPIVLSRSATTSTEQPPASWPGWFSRAEPPSITGNMIRAHLTTGTRSHLA